MALRAEVSTPQTPAERGQQQSSRPPSPAKTTRKDETQLSLRRPLGVLSCRVELAKGPLSASPERGLSPASPTAYGAGKDEFSAPTAPVRRGAPLPPTAAPGTAAVGTLTLAVTCHEARQRKDGGKDERPPTSARRAASWETQTEEETRFKGLRVGHLPGQNVCDARRQERTVHGPCSRTLSSVARTALPSRCCQAVPGWRNCY